MPKTQTEYNPIVEVSSVFRIELIRRIISQRFPSSSMLLYYIIIFSLVEWLIKVQGEWLMMDTLTFEIKSCSNQYPIDNYFSVSVKYPAMIPSTRRGDGKNAPSPR